MEEADMRISISAIWRRHRLLLASILAAAVVLPGRVPAAEFQLLNDSSSTSATPADNSPPCRTLAQAVAEADDSSGTASTQSIAQAQALGEDESCNQSTHATGNAVGRFELVPQGGDSLGDPVTVWLLPDRSNSRQQVEAAPGLSPIVFPLSPAESCKWH